MSFRKEFLRANLFLSDRDLKKFLYKENYSSIQDISRLLLVVCICVSFYYVKLEQDIKISLYLSISLAFWAIILKEMDEKLPSSFFTKKIKGFRFPRNQLTEIIDDFETYLENYKKLNLILISLATLRFFDMVDIFYAQKNFKNFLDLLKLAERHSNETGQECYYANVEEYLEYLERENLTLHINSYIFESIRKNDNPHESVNKITNKLYIKDYIKRQILSQQNPNPKISFLIQDFIPGILTELDTTNNQIKRKLERLEVPLPQL